MIEEKYKQRVYSKIFNFVAGVPRTSKEIKDRLNRYVSKLEVNTEDREELIKEILEMLKDDNTVDDVRYAHDFVINSQLSTKPRSISKIRQFLYKKGVAEEIIDKELSQISTEFEEQNAQKDLDKLVRRFQKLDGFALKNKLTTNLFRKGYSADVVYNVVDTYLGVK